MTSFCNTHQLHTVAAEVAAGTTLACRTCARHITTALPTISATCHDRHRATRMAVVDRATDR